jgi:hypothetical protein
MIRDPQALQELRDAWQSFRDYQGRITRSLAFSFARGGFFSHGAAELSDNLFMMFAFGVLHDVLLQLRDEGHFAGRDSRLGPTMSASRDALPWEDFDRLDRGRERRNDVAHRGMVFPREECRELVDAIEVQLLAWKIITQVAEGQPD